MTSYRRCFPPALLALAFLFCALVPQSVGAQGGTIFFEGCESGATGWDNFIECNGTDSYQGSFAARGWVQSPGRDLTVTPGAQYEYEIFWTGNNDFGFQVLQGTSVIAGMRGDECGGYPNMWNQCSFTFAPTSMTVRIEINWGGASWNGVLLDDISVKNTTPAPTPTPQPTFSVPPMEDTGVWYQYLYQDMHTEVIPVGASSFCPRQAAAGELIVVHTFGNTMAVGGCTRCRTGFCVAADFRYTPNTGPAPITSGNYGMVAMVQPMAYLDSRPQQMFTRSFGAWWASINGIVSQGIFTNAMVYFAMITILVVGMRAVMQTFKDWNPSAARPDYDQDADGATKRGDYDGRD